MGSQREKPDETHAISIPNLDDFLVSTDDQPVTRHLNAALYPGDTLDGEPVSLVLQREVSSCPDVIEQRVPRGRANRVREPVRSRSQRGHR